MPVPMLFLNGVCVLKLTCRVLSPIVNPFSRDIASAASWYSLIVTKPKPLHLPVSKSLITLTERTAPNGPNNCHNVRSSVSGARLYTKRVNPWLAGDSGAGGGAVGRVVLIGKVPGTVAIVGVAVRAAIAWCAGGWGVGAGAVGM